MPALPAQEHPACRPALRMPWVNSPLALTPMVLPYAGVPLPPEQPSHPPVLPCPHGGVSSGMLRVPFVALPQGDLGARAAMGCGQWGKPTCLVCKAPSSLAHALLLPPTPRATPRTPTCAWCLLGAAGCIGGVVIATLPNSVAKGHGSAGELQESWRSERRRVERGAGGTRAHPTCTMVSMRAGARAGLLCRAAEGMLLCGATFL